jgi:hypothetical protein
MILTRTSLPLHGHRFSPASRLHGVTDGYKDMSHMLGRMHIAATEYGGANK